LDLRHLGEKLISARLPFVRELCMKYQNIDPVKELVPVRPVVHYMMGGVSTDINGATPLRGLLAAGEVASPRFATRCRMRWKRARASIAKKHCWRKGRPSWASFSRDMRTSTWM